MACTALKTRQMTNNNDGIVENTEFYDSQLQFPWYNSCLVPQDQDTQKSNNHEKTQKIEETQILNSEE